MSEEQLINEIKKNPERFRSVYDAHYQRIFNYCLKRTNDFNASKDIAAETFLKAFLNIQRFKWKGIPLVSWLYRIATNETNLHFRSKKYRPTVLSELGSIQATQVSKPDLLKEKEMAERELQRHETFLKVHETVAKLPIKYQEVIALKYFERLKIREISKVLDKPEGTVKSLLSRGINLLKQQL